MLGPLRRPGIASLPRLAPLRLPPPPRQQGIQRLHPAMLAYYCRCDREASSAAIDTRGDPMLEAVAAGDLGEEATIRFLKAKLRVMQVGSVRSTWKLLIATTTGSRCSGCFPLLITATTPVNYARAYCRPRSVRRRSLTPPRRSCATAARRSKAWRAGVCWHVLVCAGMCWCMLVCAGMCWRMLVCAGMCWCVLVCDGVCLLTCAGVVCWRVLVRAGVGAADCVCPLPRLHAPRMPLVLLQGGRAGGRRHQGAQGRPSRRRQAGERVAWVPRPAPSRFATYTTSP